jgi:DNA-binding transcriptional MerR regulator/methylmalonyl-CoA mutase cobalamin-binding subunit
MNAAHDSQLPRHPIRVVAERTGVSPNLLRAWERRYEVVEPGRSAGGQRLYSDADVERILLLRRASDAGRTIGSLAGLGNAELQRLLDEDRAAQEELEGREPGPEGASEQVRAALDAVEALDPAGLERILRREVVSLGADRFLEDLVTPVLVSIGQGWRLGRLRPAHEHVAVAVIKQVLGWMLERARSTSTGPTLVMGTLTGERHELGALLAATAAALEGWNVVFMGQDLPPEEIALTAQSVKADVVGISVVNPTDWEELPRQIVSLVAELPTGVPVFLGGAAATDTARLVADLRVRAVASLGDFRSLLRERADS